MVRRVLAPLRDLTARLRGRSTHVVSLGLDCRVAHQARDFFGTTASQPFDWWISPLHGVASYLERPDPALIYGDGRLVELRGPGGELHAIASHAFGFRLFHEFPRERQVMADGTEVSVVAPGWQQHVPAAAARHAERLARLRALDHPRSRIVFLRDRLGPDPDDRSDPRPAVDRLWRALRTRYRAADVTLVLLNLRIRETPSSRVVAVDFHDPPGEGPEAWKGDAARWSSAFASLGFVAGVPAARTG
jgi:hypothetical protein